MAPPNPWLNYVYLVYFAIQPPIILLIDCVPLLYPVHLYHPPTSPFHFLQQLRTFYVSKFGDQFFFSTHPAPWFALFGYMELFFHLPIAVWAVFALWNSRRYGRPLSGVAELVLLCYGLQTAVTTATCMYEMWSWNELEMGVGGEGLGMITTKEQKMVLLFALYGPYFVLPTIMFLDMFKRVSRRIDAVDGVKKSQ